MQGLPRPRHLLPILLRLNASQALTTNLKVGRILRNGLRLRPEVVKEYVFPHQGITSDRMPFTGDKFRMHQRLRIQVRENVCEELSWQLTERV